MNPRTANTAINCLDAIDDLARKMFDVLTGGTAVEHDLRNALQGCAYIQLEAECHPRRGELERHLEALKTSLDALAAPRLRPGDSKTRRLQRVLSSTNSLRQCLNDEAAN